MSPREHHQQSVIETDRLLLREMRENDIDDLLEIFGDPETMKFYDEPFTRGRIADWVLKNQISYKLLGYGLWTLVHKDREEIIGDCGLFRQLVEEQREIEISYHVRRDQWGNGYATEAAMAAKNYGFRHTKADRLIALIQPENKASKRVAEKIGMSLIRRVTWNEDPYCLYAIDRSENDHP